MSSYTASIVTVSGAGFPVTWLFDSPAQAYKALAYFNGAGIFPELVEEGLWNDAEEVLNAIEVWRKHGDLKGYQDNHPREKT